MKRELQACNKNYLRSWVGIFLLIVTGSIVGCQDNSATRPETKAPHAEASSDKQPVAQSDTKAEPTNGGSKDVAAKDPPDNGPKPLSLPDSALTDTEEPEVEPVPASAPKPTKLPADLLEGTKLTPLNPQGTVLMDFPNKRLFLKTTACLTSGLLEMFLCLKQTKEHESIVAVDAEAYTIHAALVAMGAKEGTPVKFEPEYQRPSGDVIDIYMHYVDQQGKLQRRKAQELIRHSRQRFHEAPFETLPEGMKLDPDSNLRYDPTNKFLIWYGPMTEAERADLLKLSPDKKYQETIERFYQEGLPRETKADFVFVGSGFADDGENGKRYLAEAGFVICVANFSTAMIDVAVESSANGSESLSFEAWEERLPPPKSEVLIELVIAPKPVEKSATEKPDAEKPQPEKTEKSNSNDAEKPSDKPAEKATEKPNDATSS